MVNQCPSGGSQKQVRGTTSQPVVTNKNIYPFLFLQHTAGMTVNLLLCFVLFFIVSKRQQQCRALWYYGNCQK